MLKTHFQRNAARGLCPNARSSKKLLERFGSTSLVLPRIPRSVPARFTLAIDAETRSREKAIASALLEEGVLREYEPRRGLQENLRRALLDWSRQTASLEKFECFDFSLRLWDLDNSASGVAFVFIPSFPLKPLFIGKALRLLDDKFAGSAAGVLNLLTLCCASVQGYSFGTLRDIAGWLYWDGNYDQENAEANLSANYGGEYHREEHILPDNFAECIPNAWIKGETSAMRAALFPLLKSKDRRFTGLRLALEQASALHMKDWERLRCNLWSPLCGEGGELLPFYVFRADKDDICPRIIDDFERSAQEGEGFADCAGGFVAKSAAQEEIRKTWRQTMTALEHLRWADGILSELMDIYRDCE